jgi:hypothetical protein
MEVAYADEEVNGGVTWYNWDVVAVGGPLGQHHNPEEFLKASRKLANEPNFRAELLEAAMEDFAHRDETDLDSTFSGQ